MMGLIYSLRKVIGFFLFAVGASVAASELAQEQFYQSSRAHADQASSELLDSLQTHGCDASETLFQEKLESMRSSSMPERFPVLMTYGGCLVDSHTRSQEAVEILLEALEIKPYHVYANLLLGTAYMQQGEDESAEERFRKVLQLRPDAMTHSRLAFVLMRPVAGLEGLSDPNRRAKHLQDAEEHIRAAIAMAPDYPNHYSTLSTILQLTDKKLDARKALEKAIKLTPAFQGWTQQERLVSLANYHVTLGKAYMGAGNKREAKKHFEKGLALAPTESYRNHLQLIVDANAKRFFDPFREKTQGGGLQ